MRMMICVACQVVAITVSGILACGVSAQPGDSRTPATPKNEVTDAYYDVSVADPYRWLEKSDDQKVHQWSAAQDKRTRKYLDSLVFRKPIFDRLMKQISATSSSYSALHAVGNKVFALFTQPPKQQPMIAVLTNAADPARARVVVDPNVINPKGTTAIDWFVPSPNGAFLAVSMSDNGSEDGSVHIFDVASRKQVGEVIPRLQFPTAGGSLAWRADGNAFWYTRYPGPERSAEEQHFFQQVYFHQIGDDPAKDAYVFGKDFPKVGRDRPGQPPERKVRPGFGCERRRWRIRALCDRPAQPHHTGDALRRRKSSRP